MNETLIKSNFLLNECLMTSIILMYVVVACCLSFILSINRLFFEVITIITDNFFFIVDVLFN
jgi:hypothetical protein